MTDTIVSIVVLILVSLFAIASIIVNNNKELEK